MMKLQSEALAVATAFDVYTECRQDDILNNCVFFKFNYIWFNSILLFMESDKESQSHSYYWRSKHAFLELDRKKLHILLKMQIM